MIYQKTESKRRMWQSMNELITKWEEWANSHFVFPKHQNDIQ